MAAGQKRTGASPRGGASPKKHRTASSGPGQRSLFSAWGISVPSSSARKEAVGPIIPAAKPKTGSRLRLSKPATQAAADAAAPQPQQQHADGPVRAQSHAKRGIADENRTCPGHAQGSSPFAKRARWGSEQQQAAATAAYRLSCLDGGEPLSHAQLMRSVNPPGGRQAWRDCGGCASSDEAAQQQEGMGECCESDDDDSLGEDAVPCDGWDDHQWSRLFEVLRLDTGAGGDTGGGSAGACHGNGGPAAAHAGGAVVGAGLGASGAAGIGNAPAVGGGSGGAGDGCKRPPAEAVYFLSGDPSLAWPGAWGCAAAADDGGAAAAPTATRQLLARRNGGCSAAAAAGMQSAAADAGIGHMQRFGCGRGGEAAAVAAAAGGGGSTMHVPVKQCPYCEASFDLAMHDGLLRVHITECLERLDVEDFHGLR